MVTASQIRQARAALNLGQQEVAEACGIHKTTLSDIENEKSAGSSKAFGALQSFFENQGLEFIEGDGVRQSKSVIKRYNGATEFRLFYDDIYSVAKKTGGEIYLFNGVPSLLIKWLGEDFYKMHAERMTKIKNNFNFKVIIRQEDKQLIGSGFVTYRWFPSQLFNNKTIYIYGEKVAFIDFKEDDVQVIVIEQKEFSESERVLFQIAWDYVAKDIEA
jgi:transcriptional regulator with XRE-family HTH domain